MPSSVIYYGALTVLSYVWKTLHSVLSYVWKLGLEASMFYFHAFDYRSLIVIVA